MASLNSLYFKIQDQDAVFSGIGSYHQGEFVESKHTLWALQNVLVQKLLLEIAAENVIESLRFFTLYY